MEQLIAFLTGSCLASFIVTMTQRHLLEMGPSSPVRFVITAPTPSLVAIDSPRRLRPSVGAVPVVQKAIAPWSSVCELTCGTWLALYTPLT
ncbi:hypothetical protein AAEZ42_07455 [Limosilactobacillus fermentum]